MYEEIHMLVKNLQGRNHKLDEIKPETDKEIPDEPCQIL